MNGRACDACGAARHERPGGASLEARVAGALLRRRDMPRERSGLAYASGFAAVLFLFGYPLVPAALSLAYGAGSSGLAVALTLLLSLPAPVALVLAFAAAASLDRAPTKSGALPALFGYAVGLSGTVNALVVFAAL